MIIKNIALAGHAGTGKTTLLEALLYQGGCVERMGSVAAGTTVSDAAPEEIKRHSSVYTATRQHHAGRSEDQPAGHTGHV